MKLPLSTLFISIILILSIFTKINFAQENAILNADIHTPQINIDHVQQPGGEPLLTYEHANNNYYSDEVGSNGVNRYLGNLTSTGYVSVADHNDFYQNYNGSMECWLYPTAGSVTHDIVSKGATSTSEFHWGISGSTGKMYFRIALGVAISDGTTIPLNTWSHVAVTWSGGPNSFTIKFYLNGVQDGTNKTINNAWVHNTDAIRIGGSQNWPSDYFRGNIDEFRFWSDERTLVEIRDNRFISLGDGTNANGSGALTSSASYAGLVSSWTFNFSGAQAYDDISGHHGNWIGSAIYSVAVPGQPIPYNFALKLNGAANDHVNIPHNSNFNQNINGSMEMWIYPNSIAAEQIIIGKGAGAAQQFLWGILATSGKMFLRFNAAVVSSDGPGILTNQWSHIAVTWNLSGGSFSIKFYLNGVQNGTTKTLTATWSSNSDPVWIGNSQNWPSEFFNGYIDEFRFWSTERTLDQIKQNMYTSGRALLPISNLVGIWNFDGNLNNFSATTGINATFNVGATNNARLSAYLNETSSGAISTTFEAHPTVVNRNLSPNPFPQGYVIKPVNLPINDNATTSSTINIPGSGALTSIEVFLSVDHSWVSDLDITLVAPNGQTRELTTDNGSNGNHILTIFTDGATSVTNSGFLPPWSGVAGPEQVMGNFGNTNIQGNWTLNVADDAAGITGIFNGWGIRFNGAITGIEPGTIITPDVYALHQNYPNPFNPTTTIKFDLPKEENVTIKIYDVIGKEVMTLVSGVQKAGSYEIVLDGSNLSSGTYFYRIDAGDFTDIKKMILIK